MNKIHSLVRRFYASEFLIKKAEKHGEIPDTKETYISFFKIAWPAILETLLLFLVSFVDTLMVSVIGHEAVAIVGVNSQPRYVFLAVFLTMRISVNTIISRRKGQGDRKSANETLAQALGLTFIMSISLYVLGYFAAEPFMKLAGAGEDILKESVVYFRITMSGMLFMGLNLAINAAQRGVGNTKVSMVTNTTSNIINCLFNYLLITGKFGFPALGVRGDAIATVLGDFVACVIAFISVLKKDRFLYLEIKECFKIKIKTIKSILYNCIGPGVEQLFVRIGFLLYSMMVARLGSVALATHTICMHVLNLSFSCGEGLGIAAASLVGQNLGRERPDIALLYGKAAQRVGLLISAVLFFIFTFLGTDLVSLFTAVEDMDAATIIEQSRGIMWIIAFSSPAQISQVVFNGCLRGAGDTKFIAYTSLVSIAFIRPILTFVLCYPLAAGLIGAWISLIIDQYIRLGLSRWRFSGGIWTKIVV